MLPSRKSRTAPSNSRTIPNGGLGGCIDLRGDSPNTLLKFEQEKNDKKNPRKPKSIDIARVDDSFKPGLSPLPTPETVGSKTPKTPSYPKFRSTPLIANHDDTGNTPFNLWDRCKDNPWLATIPRKDTFLPTMNVRRQTAPVELAGSLLLPSQGFAQNNPPSTPPLASKPVRQSSNSTLSDSPPSLTHSRRSTPELLLNSHSSPTSSRPHIELPEALSIKPIMPVNQPRSFASLTIERLLKVFPVLDAQDLMQSWMTSIEKELAKFRVFASNFDHMNPAHLAALPAFCEEILLVLRQANVMCEKHTIENRKAQESTDPNGDCDAVKTMCAYNKMQHVLNVISSKFWDENSEPKEIGDIRVTILQSVQTIGDVVRNQMAYQIHHLCGGLTEDMVRQLREFDRPGTVTRSKTNSSTDSVTTKSPATEKTDSSNPHDSFGGPNAMAQDVERTRVCRPSIEPINTSNLEVTKLQVELINNGLEEIIDSYFDLGDNNTEPQVTGLQTPPPEEAEKVSSPIVDQLGQGLQQCQQPSDYGHPTRPTNTNAKTLSPISAPVSPPTPMVSPIPAPPSHSPPPPPAQCPRPIHTHHQQQHIPITAPSSQGQTHENDEIAYLRHQVRDLTTKNQHLQGDIKVLLRQLDYLRIGLATPSTGLGGRTKASRFTFPGLGSGMKARHNSGLGLGTGKTNSGDLGDAHRKRHGIVVGDRDRFGLGPALGSHPVLGLGIETQTRAGEPRWRTATVPQI